MSKMLLKTTTLLILLLVLTSAIFFVVYPNYSSFQIQLKQFDLHQISRNTVLNIFSKISYPTITEISHEQGSEGTLEFLSEEKLKEHFQEYGITEVEKDNTFLRITSADIEGEVVDGTDATSMDRGFWYYPISASPGSRGNTVLIGHRFLHLPPRRDTFFNLDKVKIGDKIYLEQNKAEYTYTVVSTRIVEKDDAKILNNTSDYRITIVTCTPLWTSEKRLVVIGKMDRVYGNI